VFLVARTSAQGLGSASRRRIFVVTLHLLPPIVPENTNNTLLRPSDLAGIPVNPSLPRSPQFTAEANVDRGFPACRRWRTE
jgi:hypothetical protein